MSSRTITAFGTAICVVISFINAKVSLFVTGTFFLWLTYRLLLKKDYTLLARLPSKVDPYASISNSKKNRLRKIAFAIGILMLMLAIGILCYAFIDFFNLSIGGKYLKAYAISFLIFGPVSILFFVMGVHFRKGLDLDILAGYTPSNYSKEQNNMVGKITGNYFIIEGFMVIVSIFIMNEFEDAVVSILAIVTLSIILLVIHVNYRLKR